MCIRDSLWTIFSDLKSGQPLNPQFIEELGDRYLDTIELHRGGALNFIDKMPANFLFYKFIKLALPGSKFIHTYHCISGGNFIIYKNIYYFI